MSILSKVQLEQIQESIRRHKRTENYINYTFDYKMYDQFLDLYSFMWKVHSYTRDYPVELFYDILAASPGYICKSQLFLPNIFKSFYRINPTTFHRIVDICKASKGLLPHIPVDIQVACIFWRFSNTHFGSLILARSGMSIVIYKQIRKAFIKVLRSQTEKMINWPYKDPRRAKITADEFKRFGGLDGVIGVVSCKRVAIHHRQISDQAVTFIDTFGVFDHQGRFIYLQASNTGNSLNKNVFSFNPLFKKMARDALGMFPNKTCLIANSNFPLMENLIPPFKRTADPLNPEQAFFNLVHSATRKKTENAYEDLKARWKFLWESQTVDSYEAIEVFLACCVLHNICIDMDDKECAGFLNHDQIELLAERSAIALQECELGFDESVAKYQNMAMRTTSAKKRKYNLKQSVQSGYLRRALMVMHLCKQQIENQVHK
ncbi:hypothetical protein [Parasitella parasitica]|uniref:DDE Tnp4 domain-containing protein n=1 Tax=Parasitella parasitica TaxID=35722 RepID=A0A0B7NFH6_9FUNG|nr:hypothetical protein [Parasitella parasitica]